jgi:hypothetical protein
LGRAVAESGGQSDKYPSVLCVSGHVRKAVEGSRSGVGIVDSEGSGDKGYSDDFGHIWFLPMLYVKSISIGRLPLLIVKLGVGMKMSL